MIILTAEHRIFFFKTMSHSVALESMELPVFGHAGFKLTETLLPLSLKCCA